MPQGLPACLAAVKAGPYKLSNRGSEHFQRGQLDVFLIDDAPDVGQLKQVGVVGRRRPSENEAQV